LIETERLLLRPPRREDFDAVASSLADAETMQYLGGPQPRSVAWRTFTGMAGAWSLYGFGMFSVIEKASGRWVGRVGPIHPEGWPGTEVGWGLVRSSWGRGYAPEAAAAAMDWAVDHLGWTDIIHTIMPTNLASIAVARKLGSSNRGPGKLPAPLEEKAIDVWGQTSDQWKARVKALR
jgi:RimJ/RimL family protein N-acetyltransferase